MQDVQVEPTDRLTIPSERPTRWLPKLVLDHETIRVLTPRGRDVVAIGKKKSKSKSWPECGDTTTAKPTCPIIEPPGTPDTPT